MAERDSASAAAIDEIVRAGRATRKRPSRRLWIAAAVVCVVSAIAIVALVLADDVPASAQRRVETEHALGFGTGIAFGLVAGLAIGYAIARQRHSSRSSP